MYNKLVSFQNTYQSKFLGIVNYDNLTVWTYFKLYSSNYVVLII